MSRSIHTTTLAKMKTQSLCHHNLELKLRTALGIKQVARMPGLTHTKQNSGGHFYAKFAWALLCKIRPLGSEGLKVFFLAWRSVAHARPRRFPGHPPVVPPAG